MHNFGGGKVRFIQFMEEVVKKGGGGKGYFKNSGGVG